jgi:hypothetical protein
MAVSLEGKTPHFYYPTVPVFENREWDRVWENVGSPGKVKETDFPLEPPGRSSLLAPCF